MDFITELSTTPGTYNTTFQLPTIFKDNTQYDKFLFYTMARRISGSNYTSFSFVFVDDSGVEITGGATYNSMADNRIGTYQSQGRNLAVNYIPLGSMGTNNSYDNIHNQLFISNAYESGKLTTWQSLGGGNYQGSSSTFNNGSNQLYGNSGWLQDNQLVAGIHFQQTYSSWSPPYNATALIKVFGIKVS